jgi:hypothetical protein
VRAEPRLLAWLGKKGGGLMGDFCFLIYFLSFSYFFFQLLEFNIKNQLSIKRTLKPKSLIDQNIHMCSSMMHQPGFPYGFINTWHLHRKAKERQGNI